VGSPARLIRLRSGPFATKVVSIEEEPSSGGGQPGRLEAWLGLLVKAGETIDLIYSQHLLQVYSFPTLRQGELEGAIHARALRESLLEPGEVLTHVGRVDSGSQTQAVVSGILETTHGSLRGAILQAGARLGRVGFAGALALRALQQRCPGGGWSLLPELAGGRSLLVAIEPGGRVFTSATAEETATASAATPERLRLAFPGQVPPVEPQTLLDLRGGAGLSLEGLELPDLLGALLPTFLEEAGWRLPSEDDLAYPYFLGLDTWAFAAAMLGLLLYTGSLAFDYADRLESASEVDRLAREKAAIVAQGKEYGARRKDLQVLEENLKGLRTESFQNARWLAFLGAVRDRTAPGLLFNSVSVDAPDITLTGSDSLATGFLDFLQMLTRLCGEQAVQFERLSSDRPDLHLFSVRIARSGANPPELPPSVSGSGRR
jgi:hypothetical protein